MRDPLHSGGLASQGAQHRSGLSGGAVFRPHRALAGGLLFGLVRGSLYTFLGAMLNCTFMFLLSRRFGRARVEGYIRQKLPAVWQARLRRAGGRQGFWLLVLLRLIPAVPYNLINYAFGLTGMGLSRYLLASAIGIIPGTLAFINIGDKALDPASPAFWAAVGLLVLLLAVTALLGRRLAVSPQSLTGMLVGLVSPLPTLVMLGDMDSRGKAAAGAFLVSGASLMAAHMGFVLCTEPELLGAVAAGKLSGAVSAAALALFLTGRPEAERTH